LTHKFFLIYLIHNIFSSYYQSKKVKSINAPILGVWFVLQVDAVIRFCGGGGGIMALIYSTDSEVMVA